MKTKPASVKSGSAPLLSVQEILERRFQEQEQEGKVQDKDHGDEINDSEPAGTLLPQGLVRPMDFRDEQKEGLVDSPRRGPVGKPGYTDTPGGIPGEELPEIEEDRAPVPAREMI